ncbi:hypothetical protein ABKV19_018058, partial [Rosa sericea]
RHILDVMHIEKNCCDAILGTVLNIPGKTKDGAASRLDMVDMGIRTDLKPTPGPKRAKLPLASWNLLLDEKKILCSSFFNMTVPVRFCSNIRNLVSMEDLRLVGLKSHDCHTIMQILLPVALRSVLEKPVRYAIIQFCLFFKAICSKVIDVSKLQQMQADLIDTVCLLEKFFPPSFFDVMIHLTVHLVREVELCGPVFLRWMYPFERYMKVFKGYVRSRHFPEGCIAENYIVEEAIEFCSERMLREDDITVGIPSRSLSGLCNGCKPLSGATMVTVSAKQLRLAHLCVLRNTEDAIPYFKEHMELLELTFPKFTKNKRWLREKQNATFGDWLKERVANAMSVPDNDVSETMRWMAGGLRHEVPTFSGYHVSGVDFNTKSRDNVRSVQNSGVFLLADAMQVASAKDRKPRTDDMDFYVVVRCSDKDYEGANDECEDPEVDQLAFIPTMPSVETFDDVVGHQPSIHMRDGDEGIWIVAPSNRAAAAKAIALRMKAVQMKRTSSKDAGPSTTPKALSPKKRVVSAKKKEVSPKKKVVQTKKKTRSPKKKTKAVSKKSVSKTKSGNSSESNKIKD